MKRIIGRWDAIKDIVFFKNPIYYVKMIRKKSINVKIIVEAIKIYKSFFLILFSLAKRCL